MERIYELYGNFKNASKIIQYQLYNGRSLQSICEEVEKEPEFLIFGLQEFGQDQYYIGSLYDHYRKNHIPTNKVLVISDTHIGRVNDDLYKLELAYNYAIKNNINYVIHVGDLIEGFSDTSVKVYSLEEQINKIREFYKKIPSNIITYYIYGNHDFNLQLHDKCDIKKHLNNLPNLQNIGTRYSYINLIDNCFIRLFHEIPSSQKDPEPPLYAFLNLHGHSHYYSVKNNNVLKLPALLNDPYTTGFIELETTDKEYITTYYPITTENKMESPKQHIFKKQLTINTNLYD